MSSPSSDFVGQAAGGEGVTPRAPRGSGGGAGTPPASQTASERIYSLQRSLEDRDYWLERSERAKHEVEFKFKKQTERLTIKIEHLTSELDGCYATIATLEKERKALKDALMSRDTTTPSGTTIAELLAKVASSDRGVQCGLFPLGDLEGSIEAYRYIRTEVGKGGEKPIDGPVATPVTPLTPKYPTIALAEERLQRLRMAPVTATKLTQTPHVVISEQAAISCATSRHTTPVRAFQFTPKSSVRTVTAEENVEDLSLDPAALYGSPPPLGSRVPALNIGNSPSISRSRSRVPSENDLLTCRVPGETPRDAHAQLLHNPDTRPPTARYMEPTSAESEPLATYRSDRNTTTPLATHRDGDSSKSSVAPLVDESHARRSHSKRKTSSSSSKLRKLMREVDSDGCDDLLSDLNKSLNPATSTIGVQTEDEGSSPARQGAVASLIRQFESNEPSPRNAASSSSRLQELVEQVRSLGLDVENGKVTATQYAKERDEVQSELLRQKESLEKQIADLEAELSKEREQGTEKQAQVAELSQRLASTTATSASEVAERDEELAKARGDLARLNSVCDEATRLKDEVHELRENCSAVTNERDVARREADTVKSELGSVAQQKESLEKQIADLEAELNKEREQGTEKQAQVAELSQRLASNVAASHVVRVCEVCPKLHAQIAELSLTSVNNTNVPALVPEVSVSDTDVESTPHTVVRFRGASLSAAVAESSVEQVSSPASPSIEQVPSIGGSMTEEAVPDTAARFVEPKPAVVDNSARKGGSASWLGYAKGYLWGSTTPDKTSSSSNTDKKSVDCMTEEREAELNAIRDAIAQQMGAAPVEVRAVTMVSSTTHPQEEATCPDVETLETTMEAPDVKATTATPEVVTALLIQEDMVSATTADDTPPTRTPVAEEEEDMVPQPAVPHEPIAIATPSETSAMWKVMGGLVKKARRDLDEDGHFLPLVITGLAASAMFMK